MTILSLVRFLLVGVLPLATVMGCSSESVELEEGLEKWNANAPSKYVLITQSTGFAGGPRHLSVVDDGEVSDCFLEADETTCSPEPDANSSDPVTLLYEQAMLDTDAELKNIEIDEEYGYLVNYYLDGGEEGWGERVTCFIPDSVDPTACED